MLLATSPGRVKTFLAGGLLLFGVIACANRDWSDWANVQALTAESRTEGQLHKDAVPQGKRKIKGLLHAVTDDSITLRLKDGQRRSLRKQEVHRVSIREPFSKWRLFWGTLATVRFRDARPIFGHFLDSVSDSVLRSEVLRLLGAYDDVEVGDLILPRWSTLSPRERRPALQALIAHRGRASRLLDAMEGEIVETAALEQDHRVLLAQHPDEAIRNRALALLRPDTPDERDRVVQHY